MSDNYPVVAKDLLNPLLDLFSLSREACGGDVDKFLILLVIAVRTTEHQAFAKLTNDQLASGEIKVFPTLGANVRSIADSLHIPKESVRRKVAEMIETGWVAREGNNLLFTAQAYREVAHVRVAIESLAVRNYELVRSLVKAAG
ncbi:MAG: hypothetical protein ABW360_10030 [Phenylobacterium sp.]